MIYNTGVFNISFDMHPAGCYVCGISNTVLEITITDRAGMLQSHVVLPDYKAYELYCTLDTMAIVEDCDLGSVALKTIELPPEQETRKSIILDRTETPVVMRILETNMINKNFSTRDYLLDINDLQYQELLEYLYCNFEMCALQTGYKASYYYDHLEEFFNDKYL